MKRYALSHGSYSQSRKFDVETVANVPSYCQSDVVDFETRQNPFYGTEYHLVLYSERNINPKKLYQLFAKLKSLAISATLTIGDEYV